jgi:sugar lactone lactonase YvrE
MLATTTACGGAAPAATPSTAATSAAATAAPDAKPDFDVALDEGDAPQNPYVAFGSVWVAAHHATYVIRIDLATGKKLARIPTGSSQPGGITAGAGLVWVTHYGSAQSLVGIDPLTNKVVRRFKLPGESCCQPAVLGSTVWVAAGGEDRPAIIGFAVTDGHVVRRVDGVDGPVVVGAALWASQQGLPVIVDPRSGAITETKAPRGAVIWASPPADGMTWVTREGAALGLSADGTVTRTVMAPGGAKLTVLEGMAVTSGRTVWVADGESTLWRIDPDAVAAVKAVTLPRDTASIAGDGKGGVWVALFGKAHVLHFAAP